MNQEEVKKKPSRPTWKMVRELEHKLVESETKACEWVSRYQTQKDELEAFKRSNDLLEKELVRVRCEVERLNNLNDERIEEITYLKSRGFWARLFNKE